MKKHERMLARILLQRREKYVLRPPELNEKYYRAMFQEVFGPPGDCLLCGTTTGKTIPNDVDIDAWFCAECCPVCDLSRKYQNLDKLTCHGAKAR